MSYPDFSPQGYQVINELGRNREGGRITWLVSNLNTSQQVVVKQFCFAQLGSNWSAFTAHEREIQVLQGLNHREIPAFVFEFFFVMLILVKLTVMLLKCYLKR
ncbi:hypothetical protein [Nostoc sp.]|uniref:hypothetical protein n=1 Tax=Nostoc sp. TaxID=1180 RepID=UPI002FF9F158